MAELAELVRLRAGNRCEYCQMPQNAYREQFQVDHIIARQHGGRSDLDNLALACLRCNRYKGPNLSGVDPDSKQIVTLFNPRQERWAEHFEWNGPRLIGLTPTGRATVEVLSINHPDRIIVRQALIEEGVFPSD